MVTKRIAIIDYKVGNLLNVVNACNYLGAATTLISSPDDIANADYLILPGVGSCQEGMKGLHERNFVSAIKEHCDKGKGLLGICLGMQLLADCSDEGGSFQTLGLIPGQVKLIPKHNAAGGTVPVPNINWLKLRINTSVDSDNTEYDSVALPQFRDVVEGKHFYFVHSYRFEAKDPADVVAIAEHGGLPINAIVKKDNIIGCQFHPEKSAQAGLLLLRHLLTL